ncbi:MAG: hypothetical protein ACJZ9F_04675 [Rhodospirillaceae bacterium]
MKNIAIYRLQRVDKALERLNIAVARLETAVQLKGQGASTLTAEKGNVAGDPAEALAELRRDYEILHAAVSKVAFQLDGTIEQLKEDVATEAT